jgi:cold-inducible RNA-binding protein
MRNIFVGNLALDTSEQTLKNVFEGFGQVLSVKIVEDRDTGAPRGFGFIEMSSDSEANAAIAGLNGKTIDGQVVSVNEARAKKPDKAAIHSQMRRHRDHRY